VCFNSAKYNTIRKNKKQLYYLRKEEEKCFYDFGEEFGDKIP
jgi:hypothetical protein